MLKRIKNLFNKKNEEASISLEENIDNLYENLSEDAIKVYLGEDLINFSDNFINVIHKIREEIKNECGFIFPEVHLLDGLWLQENEFQLYIRGKYIKNGFLIPNVQGVEDEFYETVKTILYEKIETLFTSEIAERYIDAAQKKNGWLIWNITKILSVLDIKIILQDIISSGKSINDIGYIFEKIGEQILLDGGYQEYYRSYNPHLIAIKVLQEMP